MNDFTASNGITIFVRDGGTVQFQHGTREESCGILQIFPHSEWWQTLREFFRAEADERLGRWRWPENPDYLVYGPAGDRCNARVVCELDGAVSIVFREDVGIRGAHAAQAARAYFDAHLEPKPWHAAACGDVWEFETPAFFDPFAAVLQSTARGDEWVETRTGVPVDVTSATSACQVWPGVGDGD